MEIINGYIYVEPYYYNIDHIVKIGNNKIFLDNGTTITMKSDIKEIAKAINCSKNNNEKKLDISKEIRDNINEVQKINSLMENMLLVNTHIADGLDELN